MARTGTKTKFCKNHQKETLHGVYTYENAPTAFRCMDCAREQRNARRKDPEKYEHDKAYTRKWVKANIDHVKAHKRLRTEEKRYNRMRDAMDFCYDHEEWIMNALHVLRSELTIVDIEFHVARFNTFTVDEVFQYIYNNKLSELKDKETWKASTLVKYHHGVRDNYNELPEPLKEKIRTEYKTMGLNSANAKMQKLVEKL